MGGVKNIAFSLGNVKYFPQKIERKVYYVNNAFSPLRTFNICEAE